MAFLPGLDTDHTQWRSEDYRQQWQDYLSEGRPKNLLEALELEQSQGETLNFSADVQFAQTR